MTYKVNDDDDIDEKDNVCALFDVCGGCVSGGRMMQSPLHIPTPLPHNQPQHINEPDKGSDQMKKAQKKLTLSKIDFLSSVIIIGLD